MKNRYLKKRYLSVVISILLAVAALALFAISSVSAELESNHAMVLTFRLFQQLNQNLNENMLRARSFLLESYDPLEANVVEVRDLCRKIQAPGSTFMSSKSPAIIEAAESYCLILDDSMTLIESFKAKNSLLRNSVQFLPTLIAKFENTPLEARSAELLIETLRYTATPTEDLKKDIAKKMGPRSRFVAGSPQSQRNIQELFFHVRLIVLSTQERSVIENEILSAKINTALTAFESIYQKWHDEKQKQMNRYYFALLTFCGLLGVAICVTVNKLQTTLGKLNDFNENLEEKVELRTAELSRVLSQLEQNQQMLLQSTKMSALGEMAGGIAHEINTPLGAIMLNAELLMSTAAEEGQLSMLGPLESILKTVERISKIILGLRRFSRDSSVDGKKSTLIDEVINDTLILCNEKIKAHSVVLKLNNPHRDLTMNCVPEQISQVLLNLLSNSVDAIQDQPREQRWVSIDVTTHAEHIRVSVTDSGLGISVEVQNKLMQPFFTTKGVGKGTGLGLSISKGIMEQHSGKLFYDQSANNTTFVIEIPQIKSASSAA